MSRLVLILILCLSSAASAELSNTDSSDHQWQVINYWSITCAPCRLEIPEFNHLAEILKPFNVAVVGVNFDEDDREETLRIASQMGIEFPTLTMAAVERLDLSPPTVLPTTYVLSPDNLQIATLVGIQDRTSILAQLKRLGAGSGATLVE